MRQRHLCGHGMGVLLILGLMVLHLSGCTHLHNAEKAAQAKESVDEFKKFQTSTAQVNKAMLQNLQKTEDKVTQRLAEIAQEKEQSFANQVYTVTWAQIKKDMEDKKTLEKTIDKTIIQAVTELETKLKLAKTQSKTAAEALSNAENHLKNAVKEQNLWEARKALLRGSLNVAAEAAASLKEKKLDLEKVKADWNKFLEEKIPTIGLDKDNGIIPKEETLKEALKKYTVDGAPANLGDVLGKYGGGQFDTEKAPGLTVIILGLAVDLASAKLERAKLEAEYLQKRLQALNAIKMTYIDYVIRVSSDVEIGINNKDFILNEQVLVTLKRLRRQKKGEVLQSTLTTLSYYSIIMTMEESKTLQALRKPYILDHEYSIRLSAINGREHEALISRGLGGVALYHAGGVKPETIANFLRAAQTIALSVIAGGI